MRVCRAATSRVRLLVAAAHALFLVVRSSGSTAAAAGAAQARTGMARPPCPCEPPRRDYRVLRCRGGLQSSEVEQSPEFAMDASYWLELGPRLMTTVKDMIRATEKLLDHSAASLRALHLGLEEHGAHLQELQDKAEALRKVRDEGGEEQATGEMLDLTLDVQQELMLHLGTVLMLARRAAFLQDSVSHAERLIHGGVLQELQVQCRGPRLGRLPLERRSAHDAQ